ncbi:MAG: DUF309 domain-containing protein [Metallosphaera sp.]
MERYILFYPLDAKLEFIKESEYRLIDVRECKYKEVDVIGDVEKVMNSLGRPLFYIRVGESPQDLWLLLNDCRFWEAHEILESIWRRSTGNERKFTQALILICAAMIKFRKNPKVSDELMAKALSLISELPKDLLPLFYVSLGLNAQRS